MGHLDNVLEIVREGLKTIDADGVEVISLDLDGNDIYFAEVLLAARLRPRLFIVGYNAKFPPPVEFRITYDQDYAWGGDDDFGASLASFVKLFTQFDYRLVGCNAHTGSKAFFVDRRYDDRFSDVPVDVGAIYREIRSWGYRHYGHRSSVRTIEHVIKGGE